MTVHQESAVSSDAFRTRARQNVIVLQLSVVDSNNSIGSGERYHQPVRRVSSVIGLAHPSVHPEVALRMALKGVNDTMGPDGLVPTLLVFGSLPTPLITSSDLPTHRACMAARHTAREEMATLVAAQRISRALSSRLPPATQYTISPKDTVCVSLEKTRSWEGPLLSVEHRASKHGGR